MVITSQVLSGAYILLLGILITIFHKFIADRIRGNTVSSFSRPKHPKEVKRIFGIFPWSTTSARYGGEKGRKIWFYIGLFLLIIGIAAIITGLLDILIIS